MFLPLVPTFLCLKARAVVQKKKKKMKGLFLNMMEKMYRHTAEPLGDQFSSACPLLCKSRAKKKELGKEVEE